MVLFDTTQNDIIKVSQGREIINDLNLLSNVGVICIGGGKNRQKIKETILNHKPNFQYLNIIPDRHINYYFNHEERPYTHLIILNNVTIEPDVTIGDFTFVNYGNSIFHNVNIGSYVDIAPNCTILGGVEIKDYSYIGANSVIREKIKIGHNSIIGCGSVVVNNIPDNEVWVGNPAKFLRHNTT